MNEILFETFQSTDGLLTYRDEGPRDGEALVLLHSVFADSTQFDTLIPGLTALGYRVIAPDARGHGRSANAAKPFRQADDLADLLRNLGLRQVVLVGVSMGGMIGVDTAVEHPELVRALVVSGRGLGEPDLTDPGPPPSPSGSTPHWPAETSRATSTASLSGSRGRGAASTRSIRRSWRTSARWRRAR